MPDFSLEQELHAWGFPLVAGVDEVGRGPLAGPVVAAAVVFSPALDCSEPWTSHLDDSKNEFSGSCNDVTISWRIVTVSTPSP